MALSQVPGLSALSDFAAGTKKQKEMSRSVTPLNAFQGNKQPEEQQAKLLGESETQKKLDDRFAQRQDSQQQQAGFGAAHPMMQDVVGKLGSLGLQLQGAISNFLKNTTGGLNVGLAKGGNVRYNAETGTWESSDAQVQADTSGLVQEKLQQQKQLQEVLKDYTDPTSKNIKSFEDVLALYADKNKDGVIDAEEQKWLSQVTNIANAIKRLRTVNRNSAEYQALLAQLAYMDKQGLVSSVLDAMEEYDKVFGTKIAGADTETYNLRDLLTMGMDKLQQEIDKALYQGRGLFGGDYAMQLKKTFDTSGKQYTESAKQEVLVNQQILERSKRYLGEVERQLASEKDRIAKVFQDTAAETIKEYEARLNKVPPGDRAGLERAIKWFKDTQTYLQRGGSVTDILFKSLATEAVPENVKQFMRQWLGSAVGDETARKGALAQTLEQMARTGQISYYDQTTGTVKTVTLTPEDKFEVLQILDANMTPADKEEAVRAYIRSKSNRMYEALQRGGEELQKVAPRELVSTFSQQFVDTLESFNKSFIDEAYQLAAAGYKGDALKQAMVNRLDDKYRRIEQSYINAKQALEQNKANLASNINTLRNNYNRASELKITLRDSIGKNIQSGLQLYAESAARDMPVLIDNFAIQNQLKPEEVNRLKQAAPILQTRMAQARFFGQMMAGNVEYANALRSVATKDEIDAINYYYKNPYNIFVGNQKYEQAMATLASKLPQIQEAIARTSKQEAAIEDALTRNLDDAQKYMKQLQEVEAALGTIDSQISRASAEYRRALNAVQTQTAEWLVRNAIAQQNARFDQSQGLQEHGRVATVGVTTGYSPAYEQYMGQDWAPMAAIARIQPPPPPPPQAAAPAPAQSQQPKQTREPEKDWDIGPTKKDWEELRNMPVYSSDDPRIADVGTGGIYKNLRTGETYYKPYNEKKEIEIWQKAKKAGQIMAEQDKYETARTDRSGLAEKQGYSSIDVGDSPSKREEKKSSKKTDDTAAKLRYNVWED